MKYSRLTKEQFEELHQEFINFLASQTITAEEWKNLKINKPDLAEVELDVFSDLIWEGVLGQVKYLEHISPQQIHLFHLTEDDMKLIALKITDPAIDLSTPEGFEWLRANLLNDEVAFFNANKTYSDDKALDKFKLIQQGAVITKGDLYTYFDTLVNN
jgi:cag pathogenicity island protein 24